MLWGCALMLLMLTSLVTKSQMYDIKDIQQNLKSVSEIASNSAILYIDPTEISKGNIKFNFTEGNKAVDNVIKTNLNLDSNYHFENEIMLDKFSSKVEYIVYYFDDSSEMTTYKNGVFDRMETIVYPYEFTDDIKSYVKIIKNPTICVTINVGKYNSFTDKAYLEKDIMVRSAAYEKVHR
jgi:hypothetical protein